MKKKNNIACTPLKKTRSHVDFAGFTLFEMLIAVALMGLLLSAVLGVETQLLKGDKTSRESKEEVQNIYAALTLFDEDVSSYLEGLKGAPYQLIFNTLSYTYQTEENNSGIEKVVYLVQKSQNSATLLRQKSDKFIETAPAFSPLIVAKNIHLSYADQSGSFYGSWENIQKEPTSITLTVEDFSGHTWQRTIPLMVKEKDAD